MLNSIHKTDFLNDLNLNNLTSSSSISVCAPNRILIQELFAHLDSESRKWLISNWVLCEKLFRTNLKSACERNNSKALVSQQCIESHRKMYFFTELCKKLRRLPIDSDVSFALNALCVNRLPTWDWLKHLLCSIPDPMNFISISNVHFSKMNEICDKVSDSSISNMELIKVNNRVSNLNSLSSSSGSWKSSDFIDSESCEDLPTDLVSPDKLDFVFSWLKSTSRCTFVENEDNFIFGEVITETDCSNFHSPTKGSLLFLKDEEWLQDDDSDIIFLHSDDNLLKDDLFSEAPSRLKEVNDDDSDIIFLPSDDHLPEDDFFLEVPGHLHKVNECWQERMQDVVDSPRQATKVKFAPESILVTIHSFELEEFHHDTHTLDHLHFQRRIKNSEKILSPFLTQEHRFKVQQRNSSI